MDNWAYGRELPQFMAMEAHPKGTNPVGGVFQPSLSGLVCGVMDGGEGS